MKTRTIDTSILVRLLAQDDEKQWAIATDIVSNFQLVLLPTVLMETEWVLRSRYGFDRHRITETFRAILASENFICNEQQSMIRALDAFSRGMDFADAVHVCLSAENEAFITFDRNLVRLAKKHIDSASVELAS